MQKIGAGFQKFPNKKLLQTPASIINSPYATFENDHLFSAFLQKPNQPLFIELKYQERLTLPKSPSPGAVV